MTKLCIVVAMDALSWKLYYQVAVVSSSRFMCPDAKQKKKKGFRDSLKSTRRHCRFRPWPSNSPNEQVQTLGASSHLTGSAADILVPETTAHFQWSSGVDDC